MVYGMSNIESVYCQNRDQFSEIYRYLISKEYTWIDDMAFLEIRSRDLIVYVNYPYFYARSAKYKSWKYTYWEYMDKYCKPEYYQESNPYMKEIFFNNKRKRKETKDLEFINNLFDNIIERI